MTVPCSDIASVALPSGFNMSRVIANVHHYFNPSRSSHILDYRVSSAHHDQVCVTFTIPRQMMHAFVGFCQNMAETFKLIDHQVTAVTAPSRVNSPDQVEKNNNYFNKVTSSICTCFDKYLLKGHTLKESISLTNQEIKLTFPNVSYEICKTILSKNGKLKTKSVCQPNKLKKTRNNGGLTRVKPV